jgi:hypothetical protein
METGGDVDGTEAAHECHVVAEEVGTEGFTDVGIQIDSHTIETSVYRQRGTASLRCPPAPSIRLPQQFAALYRNQTDDALSFASGVPGGSTRIDVKIPAIGTKRSASPCSTL